MSQFSKEIHHRVVRKFKRRRVIVTGIDEIWAMDLASMESFVEYNNGFKFILCIVDVFSKYSWCIPLKNKTASSILTAVKTVIEESKRSPEKIMGWGSEFYNKTFKVGLKVKTSQFIQHMVNRSL